MYAEKAGIRMQYDPYPFLNEKERISIRSLDAATTATRARAEKALLRRTVEENLNNVILSIRTRRGSMKPFCLDKWLTREALKACVQLRFHEVRTLQLQSWSALHWHLFRRRK